MPDRQFKRPEIMKVFILHSNEIPTERINSVLDILLPHNGHVEYILPDPKKYLLENIDLSIVQHDYAASGRTPEYQEVNIDGEFKAYRKIPWAEIFYYCNNFRTNNPQFEYTQGRHAPAIANSDVVVLLTDYPNEHNFFAYGDDHTPGVNNFFVQTSDWATYVDCDSRFPIVYDLASIPLLYGGFLTPEQALRMSHKEPQGCTFDLCEDKFQIHLKLRTGDICQSCREFLEQSDVEPALVRQVFRIYDSIRSQMLFRSHFRLTQELTPLNIRTSARSLSFTGMANGELKLSPWQLAIYLFVLGNPGIEYKEIPNYKDGITLHHGKASKSAILATAKNEEKRFQHSTTETIGTYITKLNSLILNKLGDEIGRHYIISNEGNTLKISLDDDKISINGGKIVRNSKGEIRL